jgi:uncharacterized protein (TIGR02266 family)
MPPKALGKFKPQTSESRRIPLEREISFRVPRFENFVTEYSANISATGIFVRTHEPLEPGTDLTLEFKVADDWKLIRGRGRVIWVRNEDEGPDAPAGMGIRFLEIDPQSRRLIHWMVDKHAREGGETFEFEELRQTADNALGADRQAFTRRLALVVLALSLLGLLYWLFLRLTPPGTDPDLLGQPGTEQAAATLPMASADELSAPPAPTASPRAGSPTSIVTNLVNDWADAWSAGDVERYLSFYSPNFTPANGLTLRQWQASRAERLSSPQHIRVSITALELEVLDADSMQATFFQNYRSDRFEDTVRKRLRLSLKDGAWRILEERVIG